MNNFIATVKGVSGSGKSSRVFQLLKFFEYAGIKQSKFKFINSAGKEREAGILFEDMNIVFIGKIYKSGSIERWQGYDSVTSCFVNSEGFSEFLKKYSEDYSFIVEGAGVTQTNRLRPKFLHEFCGFDNIFMKYYNYKSNEKDIYLQRIVSRSGELPKKDTMWDKASAFEAEYPKSLEEIKLLPSYCNVKVSYHGFNEDINDFGCDLLDFMELGGLKDEFISFVKQFDYINRNKFENFSEEKKEIKQVSSNIVTKPVKSENKQIELGYQKDDTIFNVLSLNRNKIKWEEFLYRLTPVEKIGNTLFKREDKFAPLGYGGINGGKLRQAIWLINKAKNEGFTHIISGASVKSPQLPMGSAVAYHFGMKSLHVIGATKPETAILKENVNMATWFGAEFNIIGCGFNPNLQSKVDKIVLNNPDYCKLNYGVSLGLWATNSDYLNFYGLGANQVDNIPEHIENLVIPAGSYHSCISVLFGVAKNRKRLVNLKSIFLIGVGVKKVKLLNERLKNLGKLSNLNLIDFELGLGFEGEEFETQKSKNTISLHYLDIHCEPKYDYQNDVKFNYNGLIFHPTYEGKVMDYISSNLPELISENTCFWVVGSKPTLEPMLPNCKDLGNKPTKINLRND